MGKIKEKLKNDTYLVKLHETGKLKKIAHRNLTKKSIPTHVITRTEQPKHDTIGANNIRDIAIGIKKIKQTCENRRIQNGFYNEQRNTFGLAVDGRHRGEQLQRPFDENKKTYIEQRRRKHSFANSCNAPDDGRKSRGFHKKDVREDEKIQVDRKNDDIDNSKFMLDDENGSCCGVENSIYSGRNDSESSIQEDNFEQGISSEKQILWEMQETGTQK